MTLFSRSKEIRIYLTVAAAVVLIAGFADLVRGGTAFASIALTIGYCVLVPAAIWSGRSTPTPSRARDDAPRPSYAIAGASALVIFILYLATLAPSTAMWDTSEYIAAAYVFGIPHPPGNPFFVIVGHLFSILPIGGSVAWRINVLAALSSAAAAGCWFLVIEATLSKWITARWQQRTGAMLGALVGATTFTVWNQSVVNEKVYTVSLVGLAIASWLMIRWSDDPDGPKADRLLLLVVYLLGLGYANHMAGMLAAPAVGLAVLVIRPRTFLRWRLLAGAAGMVVLGLTPFATQPIRAAYFPAINEGDPTACRTRLELSCTFSKGTLDAFEYNVNRGQYGKPSLSDRQATFPEQIAMYWLYFKWQWIRDAAGNHPALQAFLAATFLVIGLLGGWRQFATDKRGFWYFGTLMFTLTLLLIYYLNFKLGYSQDAGNPAPHEVRDRDYFFLWAFSAWSVWVAVGLVWVWEMLAESVRAAAKETKDKVEAARAERRSQAFASPVLLLAAIPLFANARAASRARHTFTAASAADFLNSVEPYGVLITAGDNDTFPLWYAQEVEGIRKDVIVACTSLLNTDWYVRQLIRRPLYDYDAARGPAIYRNQHWVKPATSPIHMTFAEADSIPEYYQLQQPMTFQKGALHATIDPRKLDYGVLQRSDLFVLRMIQDAWPERPIYFARSDGPLAKQLGFGDEVLTQGLAEKLFVPPASGAKDTVFIQDDGWYDEPRSNSLWTSVFRAPQAGIREGQWVDRASVGMSYMYLFAGAELGDALQSERQRTRAASVFGELRKLATATGLGPELSSFTPPANQSAESSAVPLEVNGAQPRAQSTEPAPRGQRGSVRK